MVRSYRRRRYSAIRRRSRRSYRAPRRRIGARRYGRSRVMRRRVLRPVHIGARYPVRTTFDRTPNFEGDAVVAQFRDIREYVIARDGNSEAATSYYNGALVPGSHFSSKQIPELKHYVDAFFNVRVIKCTIVVEFVNRGDEVKNVGISVLPLKDMTLPSWNGSLAPQDQPRTSFTTLGPKTSSRSVRRMTSYSSPIIASGDRTCVTSGGTTLLSENVDEAPEDFWYFYIWQGSNTQQAEAGETPDQAVRANVTAYYTCKFFNRQIQTTSA